MPRPLQFSERLDVKLPAGTVAALVRAKPGQQPSVTAREVIVAYCREAGIEAGVKKGLRK